ncbi:MAG: hypothetical protein WAV47_05210 [Blastocatellia bacterium]
MRKFDDARKSFEKCVKDIPNGPQCDKALLGILTAQIQLGKREDAEETLEQLHTRFPYSMATRQAERNLQQSKR